MCNTSRISNQELTDLFASVDVEFALNAELAVKRMSDKSIVQRHDGCEREYDRRLHDRRMTRKRDQVTRQLQEAIDVYREEMLRRFRMRVYVPSGVPRIRRKLDHANVVQLPVPREQKPT